MLRVKNDKQYAQTAQYLGRLNASVRGKILDLDYADYADVGAAGVSVGASVGVSDGFLRKPPPIAKLMMAAIKKNTARAPIIKSLSFMTASLPASSKG